MKKRMCAGSLSFALAITAYAVNPWIPVSGSMSGSASDMTASGKTAQEDMLSISQSGRPLQAFALGPGVVNLSPADQFSNYQWGLKNDGEFQLVEIKAKFQAADNIYSRGKGGFGLPGLGPGDFESTVTDAVTGVDINIRPAWDLYDQSEHKRSVVVAIIDTGIDYNHQEFSNAMWTNPGEIPGDGIDNDGNGYVDDIHGWNFYSGSSQIFVGEEDSHGTHAAGTIAAVRGSYGIAGITDNSYVKIMSLKALGGSDGTGSPDSVIEAIHYAEANGASICNLSMGTSSYNEALAQTMQNSKMLFIVACGNGGFAGKGYDTDYGAASVDIAAPGTYIVSTLPDNDYGFMSGTSMAAPMVTGVAAMLYSYRPELSLQDVKNILLNSSRKSDQLSGKMVSGGILDAYAALSYQQ